MRPGKDAAESGISIPSPLKLFMARASARVACTECTSVRNDFMPTEELMMVCERRECLCDGAYASMLERCWTSRR
jgi:hypothetical protein